MKLYLVLIALLLILGCKKDESIPEASVVGKGSFRIENHTINTKEPYIGVFTDNGIVNNTLVLDITDGSQIEIHFPGVSPATFNLDSSHYAHYRDQNGKFYYASHGQVLISSYSVDGNKYLANGNFYFTANAMYDPYDVVDITDGSFTNASNQ